MTDNAPIIVNHSFLPPWVKLLLLFSVVFNSGAFTIGYTYGAWQTTTFIDGNTITTGNWLTESEETIVVSPSNLQGWSFFPENTTGSQVGEMVSGPDTPPLGDGSARFFVPNSDESQVLAIGAYAGTRLDQITELSYQTYRASGGAAQAVALQFNFDADLTDTDETWQGRLVFEPHHSETVNTGAWQEWDTLTQGKWWGSGAPLNGVCPQSSPCTWTEVITAFPDGGIHATLGAVLFKAGSGWSGFDGNVDNLVIGVQTGFNIHTTTFDFEPTPPDEPYTPTTGDVIINEIMWMGSDPQQQVGSTADEWVELYNTTSEDIDLTGWSIENLGTEDNPIITIPSGTILAGGYFLIGNYPSDHANSALNDSIVVDYSTTQVQLLSSGEQLTLRDNVNSLIDQTPDGKWAAGNNTGGLRQSMERNSVPGDGTDPTSWHTCVNSGCTSTTFWDVEGDNYGTPRALNLSENDPTTPDYIDQDWSHTVGWMPDDNDLLDDSEVAGEIVEELKARELTAEEVEGDTVEDKEGADTVEKKGEGEGEKTKDEESPLNGTSGGGGKNPDANLKKDEAGEETQDPTGIIDDEKGRDEADNKIEDEEVEEGESTTKKEDNEKNDESAEAIKDQPDDDDSKNEDGEDTKTEEEMESVDPAPDQSTEEEDVNTDLNDTNQKEAETKTEEEANPQAENVGNNEPSTGSGSADGEEGADDNNVQD